jgi:signal transduction histidine kinase
VTVEDEGIGIADGDRERIFDRFFQGEAGDRRRFGGVGIGLFIVRRLAQAQNGEVTANSRASGGTAMRLRLRLAVDADAAADAAAANAAAANAAAAAADAAAAAAG